MTVEREGVAVRVDGRARRGYSEREITVERAVVTVREREECPGVCVFIVLCSLDHFLLALLCIEDLRGMLVLTHIQLAARTLNLQCFASYARVDISP